MKISNKNRDNTVNTKTQDNSICSKDREAQIAEYAYYRAKARNFESGHDVEDWLAAEQHFLQHNLSHCAGDFYTLHN
jgi:Protein of unknown function (DUF2934)